ncbi:restriction system-associated AAA family ATPase [Caulobacter sp. CCG-8]|uniref:restriction system-associated AAA family ATPase n=1 Tax=Caulobacter sp. CCG-8 TaxID=3127958 RepID=UPI00307DDA6B
MKLSLVEIHSAETCGGLLDGLRVALRRPPREGHDRFDPICLIGPNGAGKSQLLQIVAEAFQAAWNVASQAQEREAANNTLRFTIEYQIGVGEEVVDVRIVRAIDDQQPRMFTKLDGDWSELDLETAGPKFLPAVIVGYTSGENETLSLPFLVSRSSYADEVAKNAKTARKDTDAPEPRLMLIDYGTHFEVLLANLLLGEADVRARLLAAPKLNDISSFRCVIQLAHGAAPTASLETKKKVGRSKQVELTEELDLIIQSLQRAATTWHYDEKKDTYILDFLVDDQTRAAFNFFFTSPLNLYRSLHKIAMLNDLALSKDARDRVRRAVNERRFASRLPEPTDDDKIFRFEQVTFRSGEDEVDYASLSDGEHQLAQILGVFAMVDHDNALFLLDEPESHFNPQWRVKFAERIQAVRTETANGSRQEVMLTTHAPFLPSDLPKDSVRILSRTTDGRLQARIPEEETFGASFDRILDICFEIAPPIASAARDEIGKMFEITDPDELEAAIATLGDSSKKALLVGRLARLRTSL